MKLSKVQGRDPPQKILTKSETPSAFAKLRRDKHVVSCVEDFYLRPSRSNNFP
jgi:hypothetical protein